MHVRSLVVVAGFASCAAVAQEVTVLCRHYLDGGRSPGQYSLISSTYVINSVRRTIRSDRVTKLHVSLWSDGEIIAESSAGTTGLGSPPMPVQVVVVTRIDRITGDYSTRFAYRTADGRDVPSEILKAEAEGKGLWNAGPFGLADPHLVSRGNCKPVTRQF